MSLTPPSSMPFATWFCRQSVTITTKLGSQDDTGQWTFTDGPTLTVKGCLQPTSTREAQIYKRETGTSLADLYLMPTDSTGASIVGQVSKVVTATVDGLEWQVDGEMMDLCGNGVVFKLNVYRET